MAYYELDSKVGVCLAGVSHLSLVRSEKPYAV